MNRKRRNRKGISQIAGNLVILGMVTAIGSGILFHGLSEINAFNYELSNHNSMKNKKYQESLIFEHVRFIPGTSDLEVSLRNTGDTYANIESITVVKIDSQEILGSVENYNSTIFAKELSTINLNDLSLIVGSGTWDDDNYYDGEYKISIRTVHDNYFTTIASPFNT